MDKKVLLWVSISLVYVVLALTLYVNLGFPNGTNDFVFHYFKANHEYNEILVADGYDLNVFFNYPSLFHELVFFAPDPFLFWLVGFSIIFIGIPFLLYKISKTLYVIPLYFCLINFPHFAIFSSVYPSSFVILLALIYFYKRNCFVWLACFYLATLSHRSGFNLFMLILVAEFLAFILKEKLNLAVVLVGVTYNLQQLYNIVILYLPVYVIIPALHVMAKKREYFYFIILFVSFLGMQYDIRTLGIAQMIIVIFSAKYFETFKYKKLFWFACFFMLFVNFLFYIPRIVLSVIFI